MQENLENGFADGFLGPIGVLRAQRSGLEFAGGIIQAFGGAQFLRWGHCLQNSLLFGFHRGTDCPIGFTDQYKTVRLEFRRGFLARPKGLTRSPYVGQNLAE
jgi:hypothetical protein